MDKKIYKCLLCGNKTTNKSVLDGPCGQKINNEYCMGVSTIKPDCERCNDTGTINAHNPAPGHLAYAPIDCPDCKPQQMIRFGDIPGLRVKSSNDVLLDFECLKRKKP